MPVFLNRLDAPLWVFNFGIYDFLGVSLSAKRQLFYSNTAPLKFAYNCYMPSAPLSASPFLVLAMATLAIAVGAGFVGFVWYSTASPRQTTFAGVVVFVLMILQLAVSSAGVLRQWDRRPPPLLVLVGAMIAMVVGLSRSKLGATLAERTSFAVLVGAQSFRLPLELTMHRAASEGVMPVQMSYSGYNFDILTGLSAVVMSILLASGRAGRKAVRVWNLAGFCLLLNIVTIAVASLPLFRAFGDDRVNVWVADPPFVWLPGALVPAALLGHLLVWRKLRS